MRMWLRTMPRCFLVLSALAMAAACAPLPGLGQLGTTTPAVPTSYQDFEGIDSSNLGPHRSRFELEFRANEGWQYQLVTRVGQASLERSLRIEGVRDAVIAGDVRMVTEGEIRRMIGPATEDRCLQFPRQLGVNVTFLSPDDVLPAAEMREPLVGLDREEIAGRATDHYALLQEELDGWQDVQAGIWIEPASETVLRYDLRASGWDPFFNAGWGEISGSYLVQEIGAQTIEPIEGCEAPFPLPPNARNVVLVPGVVAFETSWPMQEIGEFYRQQLADTAWRLVEQQESASGALVLKYRRGVEALDITIRQMDEFVRVELLSE